MLRLPSGGLDTRLLGGSGRGLGVAYSLEGRRKMKSIATARVDVSEDGNENENDEE